MKRSIIVKSILGVALVACLAMGIYVFNAIASIPDMFKLNGQLQAEGYYTGEFEFKMLACAYDLDHGQYLTAFSRLSKLREQMETRQGLIKVPKFADKKAEIEFYLSLQNPKTGAFMDDSYPAVFYYEPTENVINHLEELAEATGQPFHLRYPMRFMDQYDTPQELTACLNDLAAVGWIGGKLPKTCYVMATQFCSSDDYQDLGGYKLSPGWKEALLKWFSDNQDPVTGTWGPRDRYTDKLINSGDINITYRTIKLFVDEQGKNRQAAFPLRYRKQLFATILAQADLPMPADSSAAEIHDWNLCRTQGVKTLTSILWQEANPADKQKAQAVMAKLVGNRFEKFYRAEEGGFVYYPDTKRATLDGTGSAIALLKNVGALSEEKRNALWGTPAQTMTDLGIKNISELSKADFNPPNTTSINSIRVYRSMPEQSFDTDIFCVVYPRATRVLDVSDLLPRVARWLDNTPQSMGNWTSREELYQELGNKEWPVVQVYTGDQGLGPVNRMLQENGELILVGFDVLQVPRTVITLKLVR
ncbi:MAG: hypothetical protein ACM3QW_05765 [Ignavibacteriales bacterium]